MKLPELETTKKGFSNVRYKIHNNGQFQN